MLELIIFSPNDACADCFFLWCHEQDNPDEQDNPENEKDLKQRSAFYHVAIDSGSEGMAFVLNQPIVADLVCVCVCVCVWLMS